MYHTIKRYIHHNLVKEESHLFYWAPVAFGTGIALYFSLHFEPSLSSVFGGLVGVAILSLILACYTKRTGTLWYRRFGIAILLVGLGFAHITYRSFDLKTPQLLGHLTYAPFQGRIDHIERLSTGTRLTISDVTFLKQFRSDKPLPQKIRVTYRGHLQPPLDTIPGDYIESTASLSPPSPPVTPRGYDFRRKAYFEGVGGVGYALKPVHKVAWDPSVSESSFLDRLSQGITHHRHQLSTYIQAHMPPQSGAIMTALVTGDRAGITRETRDQFANAGIAHILAISGLHLSLVAGFIFLVMRGGLSAIPFLALRYNTKKGSAIVALLATLVYLFISGVTIPAQRAFMMTALVLLAVLTDRIALTLRNVALAAFIVMIIKPEAIVGPSFQLSFAAVIALVAFYEACQNPLSSLYTNLSEARFPLFTKSLLYGFTLMITSLIATLATLPLTIFTFNRFSLVAVFSNLVAIPLVSFLVMPLIVISLIGGPVIFDLLAPALHWGLQSLQDIATYASALPGAMILVPTVPVSIQVICIMSLLWLALMQAQWRYGALVPLVACLLIIPYLPKPSLFIVADQSLFGIYDQETHHAMMSQKRRGAFARDNWLRSIAASSFQALPPQHSEQGRYIDTPTHVVHITEGQTKTKWRAYHQITAYLQEKKGKHAALMITPQDLKQKGCHECWLSAEGIQVMTNHSETGKRPWSLY